MLTKLQQQLALCLLVMGISTVAIAGLIATRGDTQQRPTLVAQVGHSDVIKSVRFSPNGHYILSAGLDRALQLWETDTGREIRGFWGHTHSIMSATFSSDGKAILAGDADYVARLWDVETGIEKQHFVGHSHWVRSVAISSDNRWVLTGSYDKTARLWNAQTGEEVRRFTDHADYVTAVGFSADGELCATASLDKSIRIYRRTNGESLQRMRAPAGVRSMAFSDAERLLMTGYDDGTASLWNAETGKEICSFKGDHTSPVLSVGFLRTSEGVMTGDEAGKVVMWRIPNAIALRRFELPHKDIGAMDFSGDGQLVLTGEADGATVLWNTVSGQQVRRFAGDAVRIHRLSATADGRFVLTGGTSRIAILWDLDAGREAIRFTSPGDTVSCVALGPDGKWAFTGDTDGGAYTWNTANGKEIKRYVGQRGEITSVAFSSDYETLLTGSSDDTACLWKRVTGEKLKCFATHSRAIRSVALSADGSTFLTGGDDGSARLWNTSTGLQEMIFSGHFNAVNAVAFSPTEATVLTAGFDKTIRIWSLSTGNEIKRLVGHTEQVESAAFSSDGSRVVSGSWDGTVRLWNISGKQIRSFGPHAGWGVAVAFFRDERYILAGTADGLTRLWDTSTGNEVCDLISFERGAWAVVDNGGRFDTNSIEELKDLNWVIPDDRMRALPLEIFMRQYFEPRLLSRLLEGGQSLQPSPQVSDLNRTQPLVKIANISLPDAVGRVQVTLTAENVVSQKQRDERGKPLDSGVYDLRLFRDGQLVGFSTATAKITANPLYSENAADPGMLAAWRETNGIALRQGRYEQTFAVQLPHRLDLKEVEFTAYAFNADRVKSETAKKTYTLPKALSGCRGKAYVITVGVNAYEHEGWDLSFAANDARRIAGTLHDKLMSTNQYEAVIPVTLVSDYRTSAPVEGEPARLRVLRKVMPRVLSDESATKENFHAILDLLAGRTVDEKIKSSIAGAEKLEKVTPDDLVLIAFSSHGYTDKQGKFYFIPYDTGPVPQGRITPEVLKHCISSDELSEWVREIDAGEMVMVVDTCHSAATVEAEGFKPGPMGSRGLGQLAYDKGMRILAASQADDVALENEKLQQGLLTYALMHDGLEAEQADYEPKDGKVTLDEWLGYAVERVPSLYEEVKAGHVQTFGKGSKDTGVNESAPGRESSLKKNGFQQPSLFDYKRNSQRVVLASF